MFPQNSAVPVKSVTLVDDEPLMLDLLAAAARGGGFECQTASHAEQALRLLEKRPTPLVVADLHMAGHDGAWLIREIRRRWPAIVTIVVTAAADGEAAVQCVNAGAHRYFLKPVRLDEFGAALEETFQGHRLQRAQEQHHLHLKRTLRRQTRHLRQTFLRGIHSLVRTLEARDPHTLGHSLRVRRYAMQLADVLRLDRRTRRQVGLAAKLHDIGKVAVPEAILNKPGALTAAEYTVVQQHPVIGERILRPIIHDRAILGAVRGHHERLDGTGYPDGLSGNRIPLTARLVAVADCFDALTSSRPYRGGMPAAQALDVLRQGAGRQFDGELVAGLAAVIERQQQCLYPEHQAKIKKSQPGRGEHGMIRGAASEFRGKHCEKGAHDRIQ